MKVSVNNGQINAWTRGGPGGHDRTLAEKRRKNDRKERRERLNDGNNNGQLRIANTTSGTARKTAWANMSLYCRPEEETITGTS